MIVHFLDGATYLCGVVRPVHYATRKTFFRHAPDQRCETCLAIWRLRSGSAKPRPVVKFDYVTWALTTSAAVLDYNLHSSACTASSTPDEQKARDALTRIVQRLRRRGEKRKGRKKK